MLTHIPREHVMQQQHVMYFRWWWRHSVIKFQECSPNSVTELRCLMLDYCFFADARVCDVGFHGFSLPSVVLSIESRENVIIAADERTPGRTDKSYGEGEGKVLGT